ncbi:DUF1931 domain-containing protein [Candidatus Woesearchaeota archaeon]|nr:DUF1931 domain-containing protein [Candidatus Woesearchaeota archaeon]
MPQMVVRIKVKDYISQKNMRMSQDFLDKLEEMVRSIIDKAIERAKANNRNTVMPRDL